ncbi:LacI family transcriptional regulator [Rhodococcus sp. 06-462-5]|nr:LacI family transcriptional regulator [Rhodococcus sp. 06-462-5]OZE63416.1 LacI family transcriptional regulator [Rhodococcus sp. 02-925g]
MPGRTWTTSPGTGRPTPCERRRCAVSASDSGLAHPRPNRVSAAQVARVVGVSPATVSYVMNGRSGVSEETRLRVLEVAEQLGHTSSARAHRLRSEQTRVIGLVLSDVANPFYTEIAAGVIDAARAHGYEVFLTHTQEDHDTLEPIVNAMIARNVDGVVMTVLYPSDGNVVRALRSAHIPIAQLYRRIEQIEADYVGIDDYTAAFEMMNHVADHGCKDVVTIVGPLASSATNARARGFREAVKVRGLRNTDAQQYSTYVSEQAGYDVVETILARNELPSAIVCGSDAVALGAMSALRAADVDVPGDIAVTGFDGLYSGASPLLELTTVFQPRREMASQAAELLIRRIDGSGGSFQTVLRAHHLRIGTTCGCPTARK